MGTISDKLTYLNTTKTMLRDSLNKYGSNILTTDTFRSYDTKLNEIYDKLPKVTATGQGLTISNAQNGLLDDFKMNGVDLVQDGTPTSENPQQIKVVEGRQTIINSGNNYEPVSYNIDLNLENIYLAKMPNTTYKNKIYKSNGNWYYEENVRKYIIDGTESWTTQSAYSGYYRYMFVLMENYKNDNLSYGVVGMNSHFIQRITQPHGDYEYLYLQAANNNLLSVYIQIKNLSTIANFKTWLSENNVVVWYVLANPVTTQITNVTLINQLEALYLHTGTNIITISNDNNIMPEIEITRLKELEKLA